MNSQMKNVAIFTFLSAYVVRNVLIIIIVTTAWSDDATSGEKTELT